MVRRTLRVSYMLWTTQTHQSSMLVRFCQRLTTHTRWAPMDLLCWWIL